MNEYAPQDRLEEVDLRELDRPAAPEASDDGARLAMLAAHIHHRALPQILPLLPQKEFRYRTHVFYNRNPLIYANVAPTG